MDEAIRRIIADNIRKYRNLAGMNQTELGTKIGIANPDSAKKTISFYETMQLMPRPNTVERIARACGVPAEDFYKAEESRAVGSLFSEQFMTLAPDQRNAIMQTLKVMSGQRSITGKELPDIPTLGARLRYFREEVVKEDYDTFIDGLPVNVEVFARYELDEEEPGGGFLTSLNSKYHGVLDINWLLHPVKKPCTTKDTSGDNNGDRV